jgi:Zn-dependent alcohol dehydrogenase
LPGYATFNDPDCVLAYRGRFNGGRVIIEAAMLRRSGSPRPYGESRPLRQEILQLEPPRAGELLVRIHSAGLCHSDLSTIDGVRERPTPMVLGHEAAGEVVELGPDTENFRVDDHVVMTFVPTCGSCDPCSQGRPALCEPGAVANGRGELLGGGRRLSTAEGENVYHHLGVSGFSNYAVVSARSAVRIDADVPWDIAALFGCAVLTGVGAVVNSAAVRPGESIAIFGLGGVGLAALMGATAAGAFPIIAIDPMAHKLDLARELGATHVVPASADAAEDVRALVPGGVQHALETVGKAPVLAQAYRATRRGGQTTTVGLPHPSAELSLPAMTLTSEERTVKGSYLGSCIPSRDIPRFVAMYRAGRLPVDRLLTHRMPPDQLNEGFERLAQGEGVRQVIYF